VVSYKSLSIFTVGKSTSDPEIYGYSIFASSLHVFMFSNSLSKKYHRQLRNQTRCCGSNCYYCYQLCDFWISQNIQSRVTAASALVYTRQTYHQYLHRELRFHQSFQYGNCRWSGDIFFSITKNITLIATALSQLYSQS